MRKVHNNKLRMYASVKQLLEKNRTLWETIVALSAVITKIFSKIDEIDEKRLIAEADSTGATEDKNQVEEEYIDQIVFIAGALHSYGFSKKDADLMAQTDLRESELENLREEDLVVTGKAVHNLAQIYLDALAEHAITQEDVDLLGTLGTDFDSLIGSPRTTIAERKAANERIPELIKECDEFFNKQLDRLMVRYKKTNPDFYKAYVNARLLVNHGVRHENTDETTPEQE